MTVRNRAFSENEITGTIHEYMRELFYIPTYRIRTKLIRMRALANEVTRLAIDDWIREIDRIETVHELWEVAPSNWTDEDKARIQASLAHPEDPGP